MDVEFSPDGKLLATGGHDFAVRVWDVRTGTERAVLPGHQMWTNQVAFSSDGALLISASDDGTLRFWAAATPDDVQIQAGAVREVDRMRAAGESAEAALALQIALQTSAAPLTSTWDDWFTVNTVDLHRSPRELLANWPAMRDEAPSRGTDMRWVLEQLVAEGVLRINCGGDDYVAPDGTEWSRDRCWLGGSRAEIAEPIDQTDADPLYQTERWFRTSSEPHGYSIPVPAGHYTVQLHFTETGSQESIPERRFDVVVEHEEVAKNYRPPRRAPDVITVPVDVMDGFLNIRFRTRVENPQLSAIEVVRSVRQRNPF
jgi:hypothetical protein